jgi:hypothetical protein
VSASTSDVPQVLVEIHGGDGLSLSAAGRLFPPVRGSGPGVDASTIYRWIRRGSKAADGSTVHLEGVRVGARWLTSRQAVVRFVAALSTPASQPVPAPRSPAARGRHSQRAAEQLARSGW